MLYSDSLVQSSKPAMCREILMVTAAGNRSANIGGGAVCPNIVCSRKTDENTEWGFVVALQLRIEF